MHQVEVLEVSDVDYRECLGNEIFSILVREAGIAEYDRLTFLWRYCTTVAADFHFPLSARSSRERLIYTRSALGIGVVSESSHAEAANAALRALAHQHTYMSPLERITWAEAYRV